MTPDLGSYDVIIVNSSAGKDSQAMLDVVHEAATARGLTDRLVVVHCDLGRVEWPGTRELAERQAGVYGLRFEAVRNRNWADLLERIEARGKWPDNNNRYCTSEFKTGQVRILMTRLVREIRVAHYWSANGRDGRPVRILNCLGLRRQESPRRAKKDPFRFDSLSSNGRRHVDEWLPILEWSVDDVWDRIRASGVEHHPAYDAGMPRLSCQFCVLASRSALTLAAQLSPGLAGEYAAAEERMGHRFRNDLSMADILIAASAAAAPVAAETWEA